MQDERGRVIVFIQEKVHIQKIQLWVSYPFECVTVTMETIQYGGIEWLIVSFETSIDEGISGIAFRLNGPYRGEIIG
jgi:hypothetical protein